MLISLMLLFSMQVDDPNSFELNEDLQVTEVNSASDSENEKDYDDETKGLITSKIQWTIPSPVWRNTSFRWIPVWSVQTK